MSAIDRKRFWGLAAWGLLAGGAVAQDEDPRLVGVVSAAGGDVQRVVVDEPPEAAIPGTKVLFEDALQTPAGGAAWVSLARGRGAVKLDGPGRATFSRLPQPLDAIAFALRVEQGRATVIQRSSDRGWVIVPLGGVPITGYALMRGASVAVIVDGPSVTVTSLGGEVRVYQGAWPEGGVLGAQGEPLQPGQALAGGESYLLRELVKVAAGDIADARGQADTLYRLGLASADGWIESAEQGDFTPQRMETRGGGEVFAPEGDTGFSFDQPRAPVVSTAPRVTTIVQNVRANPADALVSSGVPTSVVVGQRIRRSRIIGNPGTGNASISVNPFAERLIQLGGR